LADRPTHAVAPFDRSQHFLGNHLRLGRRVGVVGDRCRRAAALRRIGLEPTLPLCRVGVEVGSGIGRLDQDHADAELANRDIAPDAILLIVEQRTGGKTFERIEDVVTGDELF
jgi:hypothetical protein